jgi:hypothetical protein
MGQPMKHGRRRACLPILVLASLAVSAPAGSEPPIGSRIDAVPLAPVQPDTHSRDDALRLMNQFARCVGHQRRKDARAVLDLPLGSAEQNHAIARIIGVHEECMGEGGVELHFPGSALVGGLAEQLILDLYPGADVSFLAGLSDADQQRSGFAPRNLSEDFALCVLRRDPASVRALVDTQPTSPGEAAVVRKLVPQFGPCAVAGQTMTLDKPSVRLMLAFGLYRALAVTHGPGR